MPAYSGAAALPGLKAETRVWRDAYGVPHIFAASLDDAARALGYVHASERLYQMEDPAPRRPGPHRRNRRPRPPRRRSLHPHARLLPPRPEQFRGAVAVGAGAPAGLRRRRQRLPRHAQERAAAGVPDPRRYAGALEAGRHAGLGQADVPASQRQLRARGVARASGAEAAAGPGALGSSPCRKPTGRSPPRRSPARATPSSTARTISSARCCRSGTAPRTNGSSPARAPSPASPSSPTIPTSKSARRSSGISRASSRPKAR